MHLTVTDRSVDFHHGAVLAGRYAYRDPFKPHVHPLNTPMGYTVSLRSPHDHPHHKALMYALRASDVNFWEEYATTDQEKVGQQEHETFLRVVDEGSIYRNCNIRLLSNNPQIDVCWPGLAAAHAIDLKKYFTEAELKEFFPRIIENNTVDGRLIGVPFFTDAGILYYRTDLLEKYGYKAPPKTWDELAEKAKKIQDGERAAGQPDFWGFVWQGLSYKGSTCDALEWIYSSGGGTLITPEGKVTVNSPDALKALLMAKSWIGTISPAGVVTYKEEEARNVWQAGNAAFMRNWPYCYALGSAKESPIAGKFAVTVLPQGSGKGGKHAATLGGWQLMVSKYSKNQAVAADLVRYLTSAALQKRDAIELTRLPTRPALYSDPEVLAATPWFAQMLPVFTNAVARPSTVLKSNYNQFATLFFQNVSEALTNQETPDEALRKVDAGTQRLLH